MITKLAKLQTLCTHRTCQISSFLPNKFESCVKAYLDESCKHLVVIITIKNESSEEVVTSVINTYLDSQVFDKSSVQWYNNYSSIAKEKTGNNDNYGVTYMYLFSSG